MTNFGQRIPWYRSLFYWLAGWYYTWHIKKYNPELYKHLNEVVDINDPDSFVEVPRPDGGKLLIHKNALENVRKLGEEQQEL